MGDGGLIDLVACGVTLAFLNVDAVAVRGLFTDPSGYVLGRRVEGEEFVEISVVKIGGDAFLDVAEINHHTVGVKFLCPAVDGDNPVMAVQTGAFALVGQIEAVTACKFKTFADIIHRSGVESVCYKGLSPSTAKLRIYFVNTKKPHGLLDGIEVLVVKWYLVTVMNKPFRMTFV